jgi:hypothetical protein
VSQVTVAFPASLTDTAARVAHEQAIARLNSAIAGPLKYTLSMETPNDNAFTVEIDPNHSTCSAGTEPLRAAVNLTFRNGDISGGRLVYCTVEAARSSRLVLHELGHTFGLYHSSSQADVMYCSSGRPLDLSPRERLVMSLMQERRSGNMWPDSDRHLIVPMRIAESETITCGDAAHR